jgi:hypothetical protein
MQERFHTLFKSTASLVFDAARVWPGGLELSGGAIVSLQLPVRRRFLILPPANSLLRSLMLLSSIAHSARVTPREQKALRCASIH